MRAEPHENSSSAFVELEAELRALQSQLLETHHRVVAERDETIESLRKQLHLASTQAQDTTLHDSVATTDWRKNTQEAFTASRGESLCDFAPNDDGNAVEFSRTTARFDVRPALNLNKEALNNLQKRIHSQNDSREVIDAEALHSSDAEDSHSGALESKRRSLSNTSLETFVTHDGEWFMLRPDHPSRIIWNSIACLHLMYSVIVIPLMAFEIDGDAFLTFMEWHAVIFWTSDIGFSFVTGYITKLNELELRFYKVAKWYCKTWLVFDLLVVGLDWALLIMETVAASGFARIMKTTKIIRIVRYLRFARLVRIVKVDSFVTDLKDKVNSDVLLMVGTVSQQLLLVVILTHWCACLWYEIGNREGGWVQRENLKDLSFLDRYKASFTWFFSRVHPSSTRDIHQLHTFSEQIFSLFATCLGFGLQALFLSTVTNKMASINSKNEARDRKLALARQYTNRFLISKYLTVRVKRHINTVWIKQLQGEDMEALLKVLPEQILEPLKHETWSRFLIKHAFFKDLHTFHGRAERDVCFRVVDEVKVYNNDVLFLPGDSCTRTLFVVEGTFRYLRLILGSLGGKTHVTRGQYLCEAALWTEWQNRGEFKALEEGALCAISVDKFTQTLWENHVAAFIHAVEYAHAFVQKLNITSDISDLPAVQKSDRSLKSFVRGISNSWSVWSSGSKQSLPCRTHVSL